MKLSWLFFLPACFFFSASELCAQRTTAPENINKLYADSLGANIQLFTGAEYAMHTHGITGSPFYLSDIMSVASISYFGTEYEDVPIYYDLSTDEVIIRDFTKSYYIRLIAEHIDHFTVAGHRFIFVFEPKAPQGDIRKGFYEVLCEGKATILAKQIKIQAITAALEENGSKFKSQIKYFLLLHGHYTEISSKSDIIDALKDGGRDVADFIRKNKLKFNRDPGSSFCQVVMHYNQTNH